MIALYNEKGDLYFGTYIHDEEKSFYQVDQDCSEVIGRRKKVDFEELPSYLDNEGNFIGITIPVSKEYTFYKISPDNQVTTIPLGGFKEWELNADTSASKPILCHSGFYFDAEGRAIEKLNLSGSRPLIPGSDNYLDTCCYYMYNREYSIDDRSPFCVYKVDISWNQPTQ